MVSTVFTILIAVVIFTNAYALPASVILTKNWSENKQNVEKKDNVFEGDILIPPVFRARGVAVANTNVRWPNGIVPYEFAQGYTAEQQAAIVSRMRKMESLLAINNARCVQFRPKVSLDLYYITIQNADGCSSYVGQNTAMTNGQTVKLLYPDCFDDGRTMHELIHTLGFFHEQSRPDRDSYVKINWQNIQPGKEGDFTKYNNTVVNMLNMPYDYASVMHYGKKEFSNNSLPTIEPLQPNIKIGQRYKLSPIDIQEIRLFYGCTATAPTLPPTTPVTPNANTSIYSSELTSNNGIYSRIGGFGANYYYEAIQITVPIDGTYLFVCNSYLDSFASVYRVPFNSSNITANLIGAVDDTRDDNWEFSFTLNFNSVHTVILVVTTYSPNVTGPFSVIVTGPARVNFTRINSTVNPTTVPVVITTSTPAPSTCTTSANQPICPVPVVTSGKVVTVNAIGRNFTGQYSVSGYTFFNYDDRITTNGYIKTVTLQYEPTRLPTTAARIWIYVIVPSSGSYIVCSQYLVPSSQITTQVIQTYILNDNTLNVFNGTYVGIGISDTSACVKATYGGLTFYTGGADQSTNIRACLRLYFAPDVSRAGTQITYTIVT